MKRLRMESPTTEDSEQRHPMRTRFKGQQRDSGNTTTLDMDTWCAPINMKHHLSHLLNSVLSTAALKTFRDKLEVLKKCSYYTEVVRQELPHHEQNYMSNSTILHLIDPWRFQRMKNVAKSQVKVQLTLLEELFEEMCRGRQELEAILEHFHLASLAVREADLQEKMATLRQAVSNFDDIVKPGRLHLKHRLISEVANARMPQIQLVMVIKMPVVFDKSQSVVFTDSAVLHWHIAGQEQHEPGEQFEVRYRLLNPANGEESKQTGALTCCAYCLLINSLMPDRCYEFTVKRVDSWSLVYAGWNESILLHTGSRAVHEQQ